MDYPAHLDDLRDRAILRRYLAGRCNPQISKEFSLSAAHVARIIAAGKAEALGRR